MNTRDNIQAELQVLRMENVRLTNELAKRNEYDRFLETENKAVEEETRNEYETKLALMEKERDNALGKVNEAKAEAKNAKAMTEKEKCVPIMQSKCWARHARLLRRVIKEYLFYQRK